MEKFANKAANAGAPTGACCCAGACLPAFQAVPCPAHQMVVQQVGGASCLPNQGVVFIVAGAGDPAGKWVVAVCDVDGEEVIGWVGFAWRVGRIIFDFEALG